MMNFKKKSQLVLLAKRHMSGYISKPNTDADVRINSCPGRRFRYVDMFMDVILTIVFYNKRNGLSKVFRFNLLNQI